jgi:hypothetical protein
VQERSGSVGFIPHRGKGRRGHVCPAEVSQQAFSVKRRNFGRQGIYPLPYKHLWALSENEGILLANSFQPSQVDVSVEDFLGSSEFKEALYEEEFTALRGSPTVSEG